MSMLTADIVIQSPNSPEIVGKAVRAWGKVYHDAYKTQWDRRCSNSSRTATGPSSATRTKGHAHLPQGADGR